MLLPGATLGMLGGGQLGRFFTLAARNVGYRVVVLDADPESPAGQLADVHLQAGYENDAALQKMADQCDVITTEFENVPATVLKKLSELADVYPSASAVEIAQNRIREKTFIQKTGLQTALFAEINSVDDLERAAKIVPFPAILKTSELGYDGKGQVQVESAETLKTAFESIGGVRCILEERIELLREISVIIGRNPQGIARCFPVAENEHRNGILHCSTVPASCSDKVAEMARQAAIELADGLDYVGILAVEFFETRDHRVLVNEMAPRTHNSGHYTLDACITSQFEQQLRMICGLPHGETRLVAPVAMVNILGDVWQGKKRPQWDNLLAEPAAKLHLYGKGEARVGRKMAHFNLLGQQIEGLADKAETLFNAL